MTFIDGNAIAGPLSSVFAFDVTTAVGQCVGCGSVASFAEAHVYDQSPGLVMRCSSCESVLLRMVRSPDRTWLDLTGLSYVQF